MKLARWLFAGLSLVRPAHAEDCAKEPKNLEKCQPNEVVVTGTRTPESSQRATVRTDFVTREEAERRGATNVAEALQGEPTLQVTPENYGYLGRGAQMQGLDAERVLVLEDGERVIGDEGGVVDLSDISLVDVERIEYVSGPTSSLYGTNALGGVINVVGARPQTLGPSLRYRADGRISGELLGSLSGSYRHDDEWLALDTSLQYRPGIELEAGRPDLLAAPWRSTVVGLRAGTKPRRDLELRLKARWVRDRSDGIASEDKPGLGRYVTDLPHTTDRFAVRVQETLQLGGGKRLDFSLSRTWLLDEARRDRRDSPVDETRERELASQGLETILTVPEGRARTWVVGVRSDAELFRQNLDRVLTDLSHERITEIESTLLASGALYGQLGWKMTERFTLMPGVRAELHDRYGTVAAPRLATAYQLTDWLSARAALGRGFRAPSAKEYGFLFDHSALGYRVIGNADLRPETSWGATADLTARGARGRLRVGGFFNEIRDLIDSPARQNGGITEYRYSNVARARTAGADVGARLKANEALSFDAGYAFVWTRNLGEDDPPPGEMPRAPEPLPNRPAHTITLAALGELGKLNGTLRYRWVASAFAGHLEEQELTSPAFGTLDARVAFRALPALELYIGALNVLDVERNRLDPADTRPALGRELYAGLRGALPAE
jgi:outer membrane receptor for ferrienterochelin and colicins